MLDLRTAPAEHAEVIYWLSLDQITVLPQVRRRFDEASIAGLAENIREYGIQHPLLCLLRDGRAELIDGERRFRAAPLAGVSRIPVRFIDAATAGEVLARQLSCNLQREDLNVVERAEGIQRFMDQTGQTAEQAAGKLGFSPSTVCRTLPVQRLPEALKAKAETGELSADAAYLLTRVTDPDLQSALAGRTLAGELTRDGLAAQVRAWESGKLTPAKPAASRPATGEPRKPTPTWRITRTIAPGVALAVSGSGPAGTLEGLLGLLAQFMARGREACIRGGSAASVSRFLSTFKHDAPAAADGAAS